MTKVSLVFCLLVIPFFGLSSEAFASAPLSETINEAETASHRMERRSGIYADAFGDPFPSLVGFNIGYSLTDFLRVHAGVGTGKAVQPESSSYSMGGGLKLMIPSWSFTPVIGFAGTLVFDEDSPRSIASKNHLYANAGVDYTFANGFNLGAGLNYAPFAKTAFPYINIGYYFAGYSSR